MTATRTSRNASRRCAAAPPHPGPRTAGLLLAALLAVAGTACRPARPLPPERLVGAIPADRFHFGARSVNEVFHWEFTADADLRPWDIRADLALERSAQGLRLRSSDRVSLIRDVNVPARDVDRILVRMDGLHAGQTRVFWATAAQRFSAERQLVLRSADAVDGVYEFRVADHPGWDGTIRHLRLDATNFPDEPVRLISIVGARPDTNLAGDVYERDWGIEIDNELRAGIVVTPRQSRTYRLSVPETTRLHFATGLLVAPDAGEARFSITRLDGDRRQEIFSRAAGADAPGPRRWIAHSLELSPGAGGDVELELGLACPPTDDCAGAFASIEATPEEGPSGPNVVLISIDTLRADRMSLYGNDHRTTRRIDRWARSSGVTFEQAIAAAPWTLPAHVSMLTGLDPTTHDANYNSQIPQDLDLLSERLHDAGYFTAAVTGGGYVDPGFGFWQGFDVYGHWERDVSRYWSDQTAPTRELQSGVARATGLLQESAGRPFFLFFHTYAVHAPYHAQRPFFARFYGKEADPPGLTVAPRGMSMAVEDGYKLIRRLFVRNPEEGSMEAGPEDLPLVRALYDSGVAYTDRQIGRLLDQLDTDGLLENTIVVLTADHGEMLGEQGLGGHAYLNEPNLRIPLVISWPARIEGGRRVDSQVRTVDIVPTLLQLLDRPSTDTLDGVSLVPLLEGRAAEEAPPAISYAASSNRGISLRFPNGLKYLYDNSLWGTGDLDRLVPTEEGAEIPAGAADRAGLRERVEKLLEARDGLHMLLTNEGGAEDLRVRLHGPAVHRDRMKAIGLPCRCARWLGRSTAEIRVPVGRRFGVQLEDPDPGVLEVQLEAGTDTYRTEVDVMSIEGMVTVGRTEGGWARSDSPGQALTRGMAIWWQGNPRSGHDEPMDESLARQLRALGYIR